MSQRVNTLRDATGGKLIEAKRCSQGPKENRCRRSALPGRKQCEMHLEKSRRAREKKGREKEAGLAPFFNDRSLLPMKPPGR